MRDQQASTVADALVGVFCIHGVPNKLLSDQGKNYQSELLKCVYDLLDIRQLRTSPFHPQCDGLSERFNRTLLSMLSSVIADNQKNWDVLLQKLAFAYRTSVHKTTGFTPFEMVYGRRPKIPSDLVFPSEPCPVFA